LSPHKKVQDITDDELIILNNNIRKVMRRSFASGGATIKSYKDFSGNTGEYGSKFIVYNKKVDPDGNDVISEQTKDGRTTWWAPKRQK
jgi:formamidopyrimidine-DNA glycosylase